MVNNSQGLRQTGAQSISMRTSLRSGDGDGQALPLPMPRVFLLFVKEIQYEWKQASNPQGDMTGD